MPAGGCLILKVRKTKIDRGNYLLLRENESITILADSELKSSINITCKNKKLLVKFAEPKKKAVNINN